MKRAFDRVKFRQELTAAVRAGHAAAILADMARNEGITFDESLPQNIVIPGMAMDSPQSSLVTVGNSGIPWFLANYLDPKVIEVLVAPMAAAEVAGEALKGNWLSETEMFLVAEAVGETSAYGDYSQSGASNVNMNFPQRQNFLFQCFMQYGERELGRAGLAKMDWAAKQQAANALALQKALNALYLFGVANLENYGLTNDPNLPPALTAQYSWLSNASATANTIYQDVVRMFIQLQTQAQGTVRIDTGTKMVLAMSPEQSVALKQVTLYNTNSVEVLLKQNFPNIRIVTVPEYGPPENAAGQLMQLIAEEVEGQRTVECHFSAKMMAGRMVVDTTSYRQKRWSGGFGATWYRTFLCSQMYG